MSFWQNYIYEMSLSGNFRHWLILKFLFRNGVNLTKFSLLAVSKVVRLTTFASRWRTFSQNDEHFRLSEDSSSLHYYNDVIISVMASQITGVSIVCWIVSSDADPRKRQSSASLAFVRGIHRWAVNSPHKRPVMRKKFPFDDVNTATRWCIIFEDVLLGTCNSLDALRMERQIGL